MIIKKNIKTNINKNIQNGGSKPPKFSISGFSKLQRFSTGAKALGKRTANVIEKGVKGLAITPFAIAKGAVAGTIATGTTGLKTAKQIVVKSPMLAYRGLRQGIQSRVLAYKTKKLQKMQSNTTNEGQNKAGKYAEEVQKAKDSYERKKARTKEVLTNAAARIKKAAASSFGTVARGFISTYTGKKQSANTNKSKELSLLQRLTTGLRGTTAQLLMPKTIRRLTGYETQSNIRNKKTKKQVSVPSIFERTLRDVGSALRLTSGTSKQMRHADMDLKALENLEAQYKTLKKSTKTSGGKYLLAKKRLEKQFDALTTGMEATKARLKAKKTNLDADTKNKFRNTNDSAFLQYLETEKNRIEKLHITERLGAMNKLNQDVNDYRAYRRGIQLDKLNNALNRINKMKNYLQSS